MGAYVLLLKEYENDEIVIYSFGPNENMMGKIQLNKVSKKFSELEPIAHPNIPAKFYYDRASRRLAVCLLREGRNFPERTAFES
ncbi:hypothetical protein [Priestia koreensis]|uniref:hypothetical protein n=1 Tax=Priestia koreensis TaxID=284581 RepID=UPI003459A7C7